MALLLYSNLLYFRTCLIFITKFCFYFGEYSLSVLPFHEKYM